MLAPKFHPPDANYAHVWHGDVVWRHRIKGGTTDEAFRERCFAWELGVSSKNTEGKEINKTLSRYIQIITDEGEYMQGRYIV